MLVLSMYVIVFTNVIYNELFLLCLYLYLNICNHTNFITFSYFLYFLALSYIIVYFLSCFGFDFDDDFYDYDLNLLAPVLCSIYFYFWSLAFTGVAASLHYFTKVTANDNFYVEIVIGEGSVMMGFGYCTVIMPRSLVINTFCSLRISSGFSIL